MEKLAPVQAVLKSDNKEQAFEMCEAMLKHGAGHTAAIHTNDRDLVREYGQRMHACRIIWNSPSSLGGVGDIYNAIAPSLTLGCGSYGGNSVSGNVQAVNLINIKRIARRNNNMQWFKIPAKTYFEPNAIKYLRDMYGIEKAVIVCDKVMEQLGIVDKIIDQLRARSNRVTFRIIDYVEPEPSVETVERGAAMMREEFEPDTIMPSAVVPRWMRPRSCGCCTSTRKSPSPMCVRSSSISVSARSRSRRWARRPSWSASRLLPAPVPKSRRSL